MSPARDAAPILAVVHAARLNGFRPATTAATPARVDAPPLTEGRDDPVRILIAKAGLSGFVSRAVDRPSPAAPARQAAPTRFSPSSAATPGTKMTRQDYAILEIASGGEAALAALEARMGCSFAANLPGGPCYSVAATPGGSARAFSVALHQRLALQAFVGQLGDPALTLRLGPISLKAFARSGPGASGPHASGPPPQLAAGVPAALRKVLT